MRRALFAGIAATVALGTGVATAGLPNDDDNDYEGRIEKNEETYFGFDLSNNGKRVSGITAHVHYNCEGKQGSLLIETEGELEVEHGKFSGKTKGESKVDATYITEGRLIDGGKAKGTVEIKGRFGANTKCKATNDGDWRAKQGRDIDVLKP